MKILFLENYYKEFLSIIPNDISYDFLEADLNDISVSDYEAIFIRIGYKKPSQKNSL